MRAGSKAHGPCWRSSCSSPKVIQLQLHNSSALPEKLGRAGLQGKAQTQALEPVTKNQLIYKTRFMCSLPPEKTKKIPVLLTLNEIQGLFYQFCHVQEATFLSSDLMKKDSAKCNLPPHLRFAPVINNHVISTGLLIMLQIFICLSQNSQEDLVRHNLHIPTQPWRTFLAKVLVTGNTKLYIKIHFFPVITIILIINP